MDSEIQLPAICVRSLNDKLFEKKKIACREIEMFVARSEDSISIYVLFSRMTKDFNSSGKTNRIKKLIELLERDFINNTSANSKIGGLIAISSVAIALDRDAKSYIEQIIRPILICTHDSQREIRYRALEALYNVVKCVRGDVLVYLDEIFDVIIFMCEDSDHNSRDASALMDKLIKDIIIENASFDIISFIQIIRERIYAMTPNTRKLILSWINFLDSVPTIDLLLFIRELLDGLLKIACDPNLDIRRTAEGILDEFYRKITTNPDLVDFKFLVKILLMHVRVPIESDLVQNISLKWLLQCIKLAKSGDILHNTAHILAAILPCLSHTRSEDNKREIDRALQRDNIELAKMINDKLISLITSLTNDDLVCKSEKSDEGGESSISSTEESFSISKILVVLTNELELGKKASTQTRIAILEWIFQIYQNLDIVIEDHLEQQLTKILFDTVPDSSENVVLMAIRVLNKIIFKDVNEKTNFKKLIKPLLDLFHTNADILKEKESSIICELCGLRDAESVFTTCSELLLLYDDVQFICSMVYILNTILLTAKELSQMRSQLRKVNSNSHSYQLFQILYQTWCYSPISAISLCLFTKCYKLASKMILHFGDVDISIDILLETDQLIKLLESPIFTSKHTIGGEKANKSNNVRPLLLIDSITARFAQLGH